jgi:hypothetical protein
MEVLLVQAHGVGGGSSARTSGCSLVGGAPLYSQEVLLPSTHLAYDAGGGGVGGGGPVFDPSALHNLSQVHSLVIPHTHQLRRMLSKAQESM